MPGADLSPDTLSTQEQAWAAAAGAVLGRNGTPARIALNGSELPPAPVVSVALTGPATARNLGDKPVWRAVSVTGIPATALPAARAQMRITRQFKTLDGQPLDLDHLKQNTVFVLVLEGRAEDGQPHRAMLQHGLPAGWEIAGRLAGGDVPGMAWLGKLSETEAQPAADDRYAAVVALTPEQPDFRLAVRVRAVTPGTLRAAGGRGRGHVPARRVRPPGRRPDHGAGRGVRRDPTDTPPPLAGGGWGEGAAAIASPLPRPPPARGGGGLLGARPRCHRLALLLARALGAALDHAFPPDLSRLAAVGTEVLDRQDRPLALLPAPGGVWRFRADGRTAAAHQPADRRRGPPLLATTPASIRSPWSAPPRSSLAHRPRRLRRLDAGHAGRPPARTAPAHPALQADRDGRAPCSSKPATAGEGVLDIWLTLAPFGGNLEGVRAGSLAWFGVPPEALEPAQAALLVAIPRRPERLRPDRHAGRGAPPCATACWRSASAPACSMPTPRRCRPPASPLPRHAPQLAASLPRAPQVRTTLDLPLQAALERLGARALETLPQRASLAHAGGRCARARDPRAVSRRLARPGARRRAST